jgi:hypothetical protein
LLHAVSPEWVSVSLVGKPEEKGPFGRPKRRWKNNIEMYLQEVTGMVWTGFNWYRIETGCGPF